MKYIDASTNDSLEIGIMRLLNLTKEELNNAYESFYHDTEKYACDCVEDFLSNYDIDASLEYIQMYHLSRRLNGTDLHLNNNLKQLLLEETPLSLFFQKHGVTFAEGNDRIDMYYKGHLQSLDNEIKYSRGNISAVKSRLGYNQIKDYCVNGFAFREHLEKNHYFASLSKSPELVQNIERLLDIDGMAFDYNENSKFYCIEYLIPLSEVTFDINNPPENNRDKMIVFLNYALLRLYNEWKGSSFLCDENLRLRLADDAMIKSEWFVDAKEIEV